MRLSRVSLAITLLTPALLASVSSVAFALDGSIRWKVASSAHDSTATDSTSRPRPDSARARRMREVVVTASRRPQKVTDAAVTTEVISREDLKRSGAPDLQTALLQHVGIQTEAATVAGGGVQIQGLSSERVLVLIDGQPLVGRIDGQLDLSRIPTSIIERIEVIKGPQSTLYGSAAMGGVINVITRGNYMTPPMASADVTGGSNGRLDANVALQGGTDRLHLLGGVGRRTFDIQPGRTNQSDARQRRWDGDGKLRWHVNDALSVDASVLGMTEDQRWNGGQIFYFSNNDQISGNVGASLEKGSQRIGATLYASSFSHLSRQAAIPEPVSDSGDRSREGLVKGALTYNGQFGGSYLDAGIDLNRQALTTDRVSGGERILYSAEPYAQYTFTIGNLTVVPGARVTYSDQWGTHFTPKLAALYHVTPAVSLRASVGEGYRAPEFKELYLLFLNTVGGFSYVVNGNPDLKPETSRNVSGGIEWSGLASYARAQLFSNTFSRFIETELVGTSPTGTEMYTYRNVDNGATRGVDVETGTAIGRLTLDGSYEFLSAVQRDSNVALLDRAKHTGRASADYALPLATRAGLTVLYTSRAPVSRVSGVTTYRGSYTRTDARVAKTVIQGVDVQAGVEDIFDIRPAGWPGYAGRQWYAGLSLNRAF